MQPTQKRLVVLGGTFLLALGMLLYFQAQRAGDPGATAEKARSKLALAVPVEDRQPIISGLFHGALATVTDGTDFTETPGYVRIIDHVRAMPPEDFASRITGALDWKAAVENPARWRGEFVRYRGLLADIYPVKLHTPVEGLEDVYRGFAAQPDGSEMVAFDLVEKPDSMDRTRDVVDIEGVFYRSAQYEGRSEEPGKPGQIREVPYLIARRVTIYDPDAGRAPWYYTAAKIGAVMVASIIGVMIFLRWSSRRRAPSRQQGAGFREMFEERLRADKNSPPDRDKSI
jgi:hypothetical protein